MTKFTDLTKEQQEHFEYITGRYNIPDGTTHLRISEKSSDTFLRMDLDGYSWYWSSSFGSWKQILPEHLRMYSDIYPLPSPPYYDPEDVSLKSSASNALDVQEGGNHYKKCKIQPIEYIHANNIGYLEGNVIKYVTRHKDKNGVEDIKKAMHYLELILEMQYGDN